MRRLEQSHDNVIGYSITGDPSDEQYTAVLSQLRDDIARHGSIRVLIRAHDVPLSTVTNALGERLRFAQDHAQDIDRIALVTNETSLEMLSKLPDALGSFEVKSFALDDEDKAWAWLA